MQQNEDKSMEEIKELLKNNQIQFQEEDLKFNDDVSLKKIRHGKEDKSPLNKPQSKKDTTKP